MQRAKSTIEQWRILQAVVDCGGYAKAADELNKSQSSLNHAVAKLQHQLGVSLLEVKGRKAFLTPAGEVMLRRSRLLTQNVRDLEQLADNLSQGWEPEITLVVEIIHPKALLYQALQDFLPQSRGTRIRILDSVITGSQEAVEDNVADLVIAGFIPKGYLAEPLTEVTMLPVCHPNHPMAKMAKIDSHELSQHLQIVIKDSGSRPSQDRGWLKSEQRWTVSNFHEALDLVKRGVGFCWLPKHLICPLLDKGELFRFALEQGSERKLHTHLVIPDETNLGPCAGALAQVILASHKNALDET